MGWLRELSFRGSCSPFWQSSCSILSKFHLLILYFRVDMYTALQSLITRLCSNSATTNRGTQYLQRSRKAMRRTRSALVFPLSRATTAKPGLGLYGQL